MSTSFPLPSSPHWVPRTTATWASRGFSSTATAADAWTLNDLWWSLKPWLRWLSKRVFGAKLTLILLWILCCLGNAPNLCAHILCETSVCESTCNNLRKSQAKALNSQRITKTKYLRYLPCLPWRSRLAWSRVATVTKPSIIEEYRSYFIAPSDPRIPRYRGGVAPWRCASRHSQILTLMHDVTRVCKCWQKQIAGVTSKRWGTECLNCCKCLKFTQPEAPKP